MSFNVTLQRNANRNDAMLGAYPDGDAPVIDATLITMNALNYQGAFRIAGGTYGSSAAAYTDNYAITINEQNGNLLMTGGGSAKDDIGEFDIPSVLSTSTTITDLPIAANTQPFIDVFDQIPERTVDFNEANGIDIFGIYNIGNDVILNYAVYYDAQAPYATETTFIKPNAANLGASTSDTIGAFKLEGRTLCSGWISPIPAEWQAALGGDHITGFASGTTRGIISNFSAGPSAYVFNIADLTSHPANGTTIQTTPAMSFPYPNAMGIVDVNNPSTYLDGGNAGMWNKASTADYGFIVPNTSTYMCLGYEAGYESGLSYKARNGTSQTDWGDYDATDPDDYRNTYYLFDVNDLVRAKNGEINAYDIVPYDWGTFSPVFGADPISGIERVSGATYDPNTGRLYVVLEGPDTFQGTGTGHPVIEVYTLDGGA